MPRFTEERLREAVTDADSYREVLRSLGMTPAGGNPQTIKLWVGRYGISTAHFNAQPRERWSGVTRSRPLDEVMTERSTYSRKQLKKRLYSEGLKARACEMCAQGEEWRGGHMSLILDHINGVADDHRLENLRIICPNCAATLDTHCGRHNLRKLVDCCCLTCASEFRPLYAAQQFCSRECWRASELRRVPRYALRVVERPSYAQLSEEISTTSYVAVGRKYGVSDNAVRKWVRWYEEEAAREAARGPA